MATVVVLLLIFPRSNVAGSLRWLVMRAMVIGLGEISLNNQLLP